MSFLELAKKRCSTRSFTKEKVHLDQIDVILEASRVAPTTANSQSQQIIVVTNEELIRELSNHAQLYNAKCVFVVGYDKNKAFRSPIHTDDSGVIDTTVILTHMMLAAADIGLGSVWVNYFQSDSIKKVLNLDLNIEVVHILAVGFPNVPLKDSNRHNKERKPLSETVVLKD